MQNSTFETKHKHMHKSVSINEDFHSVQFSEHAEFCDRFFFEMCSSAISNVSFDLTTHISKESGRTKSSAR